MPRPLADLRVVELGDPRCVGYAGRVLADLGAGVVRVDAAVPTDPGDRRLVRCLDVGKTRLCPERDAAAVGAAIAGAAVLLCGPAPRDARAATDPAALHRAHPGKVVVSVTPFGIAPGPRAGWPADDLTLQACAGMSLGIGAADRPPLKLPGDQSAFQGGLAAAVAALGAWLGGRGALIDVAIADVWAAFYGGVDVALAHFGRFARRRAGHRVAGQPYPRTLFRCRDGWFAIQCGESRHWEAFLAMLGREELAADPRFANRFEANDRHGDACDALVEPWFRERTKAQVLAACLAQRIPGAPVYELGEVLAHAHLRGRGYFRADAEPGSGLVLPGDPWAGLTRPLPLAGDAADDRGQPASAGCPDAGTDRVATVASGREAAVERHRPGARGPGGAAPGPRRPLAGLRVVDFGWVWAGAVPGHVLADLGAEVVKVESARPLDYMRQGRPIVGTRKDPEQNPMFQNVNRGKRSLRIRLDHPQARGVLLDLVARSDVVVENFSPGVMDRFGLGYDQLRRVRPGVVMCSMSAVGQTGPLRGIRTYATMIAGLAGLDALVGYEGDRVLGSQSSYADPNASLHAVAGILAALARRRTTGEGAWIDLSQWEAAAGLLAEQWVDLQQDGTVRAPCGLAHRVKAPHGHYPVLGDDRWIAISVDGETQWRALRSVLGEPGWMADPAWGTAGQRRDGRTRLDGLLAAATATREGAALAAALAQAGVPAALLQDARALEGDAHFRARGLFERVAHPVLGDVPVYRLPWQIDGAPIPVTGRAPLLGEHNACVLRETLGYDADRVRRLDEAGLFA